MGRPVRQSALILAVLVLSNLALGADQTTATRDAVAAMQHGDFPSAEKTLRAEVAAHPDEAWALSLLAVALDNQKRLPEAEDFHRRAIAQAPASAEILNNYGTHLWSAAQYDRAETVFAKALAAAPSYFLVQFNLGVMATYTGHYDRAREVLETALRQQPANVDVLYRLACVDQATRHWESAVMRLAQAAKLDPRRADVQKLLALSASQLGALDDAAAAWDRYLKLEPGDESARRERGYTAAQMGKLEDGIADLQWFVSRHPDDPVGHYELGQAQRTLDATQSLAHLDRALSLNPAYAPARAARGGLYYQEGKPESAVKDLELAASLQPEDAANLDRLGQTYQALDRSADAVRVLRRAAELAPDDSKTLLHLARALADAGKTDESKLVMDRFRQLGPEKKKGVPAGLVDYLSLAPGQRHAEYRARVEKTVADRPDDPAAQLAYLKLMLEDREADRVAPAAKKLAALQTSPALLADAGHALLTADYYALAAELLDHLPEPERGSDYYLAQAQMLEASGKSPAALAALHEALRVSPNRPDLYLRTTAILVKKGEAAEALRMIGEGARLLPGNRDILLMQATTFEFARRPGDAGRLLADLQGRWPEWFAVWAAHGIILHSHQRYEEARQSLETAVALGARSPETYFYLADCAFRAGHRDAAEAAIQTALKASPGDPWIKTLAARIANGQAPSNADADAPPYLQRLFEGSLPRESSP